ncbi:3-ketoacyl-ACP reductase [Planomicrobium sp. YIM 101495]|uniref:3-ketoacyl-ACP reductase n=1 Tax=Planomicrobium sp. YIM 101495 TaxID=2665160 RepID=UPI0012B8E96C|nr:3-ketoacyl-ACP reductase [Planomicrobium sp. YIM 101495]MTD30698.1 3-ketoacyl-ACP reductase [Planomicrobium sp. YIM 101495]
MGQSLEGKVAIITGAGRGIGRSTALALADEGVRVGLIARTEKDLEAVVKEIEAKGGTAAFAAADVSSLEGVETAIAMLTEKLGTADILINNAGFGRYAPFMDLTPDDWTGMFEVNVLGMFHVTRTVLPQMIEKKRGDIINISSMSGVNGTKGSSAYSATKFGVLGMTQSLAQEMRQHNIRVSALTPSRVITDFSGADVPDASEEKFMQPEDIAEYMIAQLKLHPRIFIPQSSQWATNPF